MTQPSSGTIADRLVALFEPRTFYDAGCSTGLLVRAMADLGVDARGGDNSTSAIDRAPTGLADRLEVRDLTEPLPGRYDLISCIDVLERLPAPDARAVVVNLCRATDLILVSSTPVDFAEPTHINVRSQSQWAQEFAVSGFFRRTDIDASFVTPWAVVYQRSAPTAVQLVVGYESMLAPLTLELAAKRQALLEAGRGHPDPTAERLNRLAMADELIGARAELALVKVQAENAVVEAGREAVRLREVLVATQADLASARSESVGLRASTTWRVGRVVVLPVRMVRLPAQLARRLARRVKRILTP